MAPPRSLPELLADLVGEVILRLPPDDPACLVRASLVCKLWHGIISHPAFPGRYRAFHRAPPLLGFFYDFNPFSCLTMPLFSSTAAPCPVPKPVLGYYDWSVIGCRHGRVLFDVFGSSVGLVVWDPVAGGHCVLPHPPTRRRCVLSAAAVLCAARGCSHLDCHGGAFAVVLMGLDDAAMVMQAQVYSSESGAWNLYAHDDEHLRHHVSHMPSALVGDDIYFGLDSDSSSSAALLRYNLVKNCLSTINTPLSDKHVWGSAIMPMEDGSLGFADIRGSELCLWSKNVDKEVNNAGWERRNVIELAALMPSWCSEASVVGFAEEAGVVGVEIN